MRDVLLAVLYNGPVTALGLVAASCVWLLLAVDRAMLAAVLGYPLVGSWLDTTCRALGTICTLMQVALCVLLIGGLLQAAQESLETGRRARARSLLLPARRAAWLLAAAAIASVPIVLLIAAARSSSYHSLPQPYEWTAAAMQRMVGDADLGVLVPVGIAVATIGVALLALSPSLIVDRGMNPFAALSTSMRLSEKRMRLSHLPAACLSAAGMLAVAAVASWGVGVGDQGSDAIWHGHAGAWWFATHLPWVSMARVAIPTCVGAAIATMLGAALYLRLAGKPATSETAATSVRSSAPKPAAQAAPMTRGRLWMPAAVSGVVIVGLAIALALGALVEGSRHVYVRPGTRVTLRCGLSYVVPAQGDGADLYTYRRWASWLPCGQNAPEPFRPFAIGGATDRTAWFGRGLPPLRFFSAETVYSPHSYALQRAETEPVFSRSADGTVTLRWAGPTSVAFYVVVREPGKSAGVLDLYVGAKRGPVSTLDFERAWRGLKIEGAELPPSQ